MGHDIVPSDLSSDALQRVRFVLWSSCWSHIAWIFERWIAFLHQPRWNRVIRNMCRFNSYVIALTDASRWCFLIIDSSENESFHLRYATSVWKLYKKYLRLRWNWNQHRFWWWSWSDQTNDHFVDMHRSISSNDVELENRRHVSFDWKLLQSDE